LLLPFPPGLAAPLVEMREGDPGLGLGVVRIDAQGPLEVVHRLRIRLGGAPLETVHPAQPAFVGLERLGRTAAGSREERLFNPRDEGVDDAKSDLVVQFVEAASVVAARPEMPAAPRLLEADVDADALSPWAERTGKDAE